MNNEILEKLPENMDDVDFCSVVYYNGEYRTISIKKIPKDIPPDRSKIAEEMFKYIHGRHGVTKEDLMVRSRKGQKVMFRYIIVYILRQYKGDGFTLEKCGAEVGLDHSMVIYAQKTMKDILKSKDPYYNTFKEIYNEMLNLFGPNDGEKRY